MVLVYLAKFVCYLVPNVFLFWRGERSYAASPSRARLLRQCLSLWYRLYLRPLFKTAISSLVKEMLILFTTLG